MKNLFERIRRTNKFVFPVVFGLLIGLGLLFQNASPTSSLNLNGLYSQANIAGKIRLYDWKLHSFIDQPPEPGIGYHAVLDFDGHLVLGSNFDRNGGHTRLADVVGLSDPSSTGAGTVRFFKDGTAEVSGRYLTLDRPTEATKIGNY